jgi:hypothetical protein
MKREEEEFRVKKLYLAETRKRLYAREAAVD